MEEDIINNMTDEAKSVEEFLGRYRQWPENGRSVARDVARRYLIIRDERDALKAELQRAREASRWILVSERMPDEHEQVLLFWTDYDEQQIGRYSGGDWTVDEAGLCATPTHWQNLTSPAEIMLGGK